MRAPISIQSHYPDEFSHCYGCGRLNRSGLHLESFWTGDYATAQFQPSASHMAVPGFVYGGLIASLADCHAMATAAAASYVEEGREQGSEPRLRFVTGQLEVRYVRPTPLGPVLDIRGWPIEVGARKVRVGVSISAGGIECVTATAIAVRAPVSMVGP